MSNIVPTSGGNAPTMTSLELVDFINSERGEAGSKLAHSDFLKKVPQVLGRDAGNFSSVYRGGNGQGRPCYRFPKREACLMAMSYSYELQAKVFDRMSELETVTAGGRFYVPQTMPDALRLAADLARIQSGLLEHKVTTVGRSDGSEKMVEQCRITPRGLSKLAELLNEKEAA